MRESIEENMRFVSARVNGEPFRPHIQPEPLISIQEETGAEFIPALIPFIKPHWLEAGRDHEKMPVDVDFDQWLAMEMKNKTLVITAREHENRRLIGYIVSIVNSHINYKTSKVCTVVVYYVDPFQRRRGIFHSMADLTEKAAKARGCVRMLNREKPGANSIRPYLEENGYTLVETVYEKALT